MKKVIEERINYKIDIDNGKTKIMIVDRQSYSRHDTKNIRQYQVVNQFIYPGELITKLYARNKVKNRNSTKN